MTTGFIVRVTLEIIAVLALAYGFLHEDKVIAFEDRMAAKFRGRKSGKTARSGRAKAGRAAAKTPVRAAAMDGVERAMQKSAALTNAEKKARAEEAAYCRNQAMAMRAAKRVKAARTARSASASRTNRTAAVARTTGRSGNSAA